MTFDYYTAIDIIGEWCVVGNKLILIMSSIGRQLIQIYFCDFVWMPRLDVHFRLYVLGIDKVYFNVFKTIYHASKMLTTVSDLNHLHKVLKVIVVG